MAHGAALPLLATISLLLAGVAVAQPATSRAAQVPAPTAADQMFRLGAMAQPAENKPTAAKVELGKTLFFDPRLSGNGTLACAGCHNPALGWSDGLPTGVGINGTVLGRGTPTIVNTGFNTQFMWDGRKKSLEDQALGPMNAPEEMHSDMAAVKRMLADSPGYRSLFERAFPGAPIDETTMARAIAAFERTVVSRDSRFDRWLAGDLRAITLAEWRGLRVFADPQRGNCATCHSGGIFTDNGFHNIGIAKPPGRTDVGRFAVRAVASMKGAFKTPTLRDVALTAPYFHDGSAATLADVVEHYDRGGDDRSNVSRDVRPLKLSTQDKADLVAFLHALTGRAQPITLPQLPAVNSAVTARAAPTPTSPTLAPPAATTTTARLEK